MLGAVLARTLKGPIQRWERKRGVGSVTVEQDLVAGGELDVAAARVESRLALVLSLLAAAPGPRQ